MEKLIKILDENINEYFNQLFTSFDFKIIINKIAETIFDSYDFQGCFLSILTHSGNELKPVILKISEKTESSTYPLLKKMRPFVNKGVINKCLMQKHAVFYPEAEHKIMDAEHSLKLIETLGIKSLFYYPVYRNNRPYGIFCIYSSEDRLPLSSDDVHVIEKFLNQVTPHIVNSYKYYTLVEKAEEIEILTGISNNISMDFDYEKVIDSVLNYMKIFYGFEGAYLSLVNKEKSAFAIVSIRVVENYADVKQEIVGVSFPLIKEQSRTADCVLNNKSYFFTDLTEEILSQIECELNKKIAQLLHPKSVLHLPVWAGEEPLGSFTLFAHQHSIYLNEDDFQAIQRFVNQLAITIRNSQILSEVKKKNAELASLNEITREISVSFQYDTVLEKIVHYMMNTYKFEGCGLYLVLEDSNTYSFIRGFFPPHLQDFVETMKGIRLPLNPELGWVPQCIISNCISYHMNLDHETDIDDVNRKVVDFLKIKTVLNMPITIGEEVIGAFSLTTHEKSVYLTHEDMLSIQRFVNQIAVIMKNAKLYSEVQQKTIELEEKERIISKDLYLAEKIQKSIFNNIEKTLAGLEVYTHYKPLMQVGGDIYDIFEMGNGYIRCFLADAAGHGVQAALTTIMIKSEYDKIKESRLKPGEILNKLNTVFFSRFLTLNVFFSCCILDIDIKNKKIYYSSAGHPDQILVSGEDLTGLNATGRIIGIVEYSDCTTETYPFKNGDKVLLFTDGIFEEFSVSQTELGLDGLFRIIQEQQKKSVEEIIKTILSETEKWRGNNPVNDDATLIGIYFP